MPPREAVKLVAKLAQALDYAHGEGIIHRDLKPSNIMLCPGTGPTVMDFGLAKQTVRQDRKLTQTGMAMGTPGYMPPEQIKGDLDNIGPASDVYSLGVIFFELLTGRLPFEGSPVEVMGNVLLTPNPLPSQFRPGLPRVLDTVCGKAMAKQPEDRYATMKEFAATLQDLLRTLPTKQEAGAGTMPVSGKNREDMFNMPTVVPEPPPVPKRAPPIKATMLERQRVIARPATRRTSMVVALCLALLLVGGAVFTMFILSGGGPGGDTNRSKDKKDKAASKDKDKKNDKPNGQPDKEKEEGPKGMAEAFARDFKAKGPEEIADAFTNDFDIQLVRIPAGTFMMGSPKGEEGRGNDEEEHRVEISSFHMGIHEVTQKQYRSVMGTNPSYFSKDGGGKDKVNGMNTDDFPVENVSWEDAIEFCRKLTEKDKKLPPGWVYRLPREAEWEYACRGGLASQPTHFGNSLSSRQANFDGNFPYGGADKGDYLERTCKVGSYEKNRFGLYDMHGNVWEWCMDWYDKDYYGKSPPKDPPGPLGPASARVLRGGCGLDYGRFCRSANRNGYGPGGRDQCYGFRLVAVPLVGAK